MNDTERPPHCLRCGHPLDDHEPYQYKGTRELLFCNVKGCNCEVAEDEW